MNNILLLFFLVGSFVVNAETIKHNNCEVTDIRLESLSPEHYSEVNVNGFSELHDKLLKQMVRNELIKKGYKLSDENRSDQITIFLGTIGTTVVQMQRSQGEFYLLPHDTEVDLHDFLYAEQYKVVYVLDNNRSGVSERFRVRNYDHIFVKKKRTRRFFKNHIKYSIGHVKWGINKLPYCEIK